MFHHRISFSDELVPIIMIFITSINTLTDTIKNICSEYRCVRNVTFNGRLPGVLTDWVNIWEFVVFKKFLGYVLLEHSKTMKTLEEPFPETNNLDRLQYNQFSDQAKIISALHYIFLPEKINLWSKHLLRLYLNII